MRRIATVEEKPEEVKVDDTNVEVIALTAVEGTIVGNSPGSASGFSR